MRPFGRIWSCCGLSRMERDAKPADGGGGPNMALQLTSSSVGPRRPSRPRCLNASIVGQTL